MKKEIIDAAREYIARQARRSHPEGEFDKAGRWYPAPAEKQECCSLVRWPSRAWPYSLLVHCRTAVHVARLFGVDEKELRKAVRLLKSAEVALAVLGGGKNDP